MADESASSKLDNLSKEELVKLIKKYIVLQKQLKIKNQDLTNRVKNAEENSTNQTPGKIKEQEEKNGELSKSNDQLIQENIQLKLSIESLTQEIEKSKSVAEEYEQFKLEICPQLENARQEIELNKSMLDILNNEIQMLNSDKMGLEKRLFSTRRNVTPSIIVEEDEEDLEEEKRNDGNNMGYVQSQNDDTYEESYEEDNLDAIESHDHDMMLLNRGPSTNDGILILNKQIEDLTFYCDELKSELEAEREKNNEYITEIKNYRTQIEDFEQQHEFNSIESNSINECLKKSNSDAFTLIAEKDQLIKDLECKIERLVDANGAGNSDRLDRFLTVFSEQILEKKNYEAFIGEELVFGNDSSKINKIVEKLKELYKSNEDRLSGQMVKNFEAQKGFEAQMERVIRDFRAEINSVEESLNDKKIELNEYKLKTEKDLKLVQTELETEKTKSQATNKEISKNKLLDLELADYERSIKVLNFQITNKDKEISALKINVEEIKKNLAEITNNNEKLLKEKESSEEKNVKLKQLLIKAKKEVADAQEHEHQHLSNDVQLKTQIENFNIEIENYKICLAASSADALKFQEKLDRANETHSQELDKFESKLCESETVRNDLSQQLAKLKNDYDNYKVKVQHAFKKQKEQNDSVGSSVLNSSNDADAEKGMQVIRQKNEELVGKLEETSEKLLSIERENETIREEFTKSLQRNTKLLAELKEKEAEWRTKNNVANETNSSLSEQVNETIRTLKIEREAESQNFKEKLRQLSLENAQTVSDLQRQILESTQEIDNLNRQLSELKEKHNSLEQQKNSSMNTSLTSQSPQKDSNSMRLTPQKSVDLTNNFILRQVENIDRSFEATKPHNQSKSIEELLNEPSTSPNISINNNSNSISDSKLLLHQMELLRLDMDKGKLQLVHLNELLNESELNNSRLTDQINVLKDEIRRLERNQERDKSIANMEYLKNVVYKFLTFTNYEEKTQLLPVLSTMLKLSPAEQNAIMNAKVADPDLEFKSFVHPDLDDDDEGDYDDEEKSLII